MTPPSILAVPASVVAAGGLLAGCLSTPVENKACTVEVCQTLTACQAFPKGGINLNSCGPSTSPGDDPAQDDAGAIYCVMACNQDNLVDLFNCVASHFSAQTCADISADGGFPFGAIFEVCEASPDAGTGSPVSSLNDTLGFCQAGSGSCNVCQERCDYIANQCDYSCATADDDRGACFSCTYACNQQNVQCWRSCP